MTLKYPSQLVEANVDYVVFRPHEFRSNASGEDGPPVAEPVVLYMPNSTPAVGNMNNWGPESFEGPLGALRRDLGIEGVGAIDEMGSHGGMGNLRGEGRAVGERLKRAFESTTSSAGAAAKQVGVSAVAGFAMTNPNTLMALGRGQIYNPNVELIYQGPQLRSFNFDYTFLPKNETEAQTVNRIIKHFKIWSSPEEDGGMYKIPPVWVVQYMSGGTRNINMNQFRRAALVGISVQDNTEETMHKSYDAGVPVSTSIQLNFHEVDVITKTDQEDAGRSGNRGF